MSTQLLLVSQIEQKGIWKKKKRVIRQKICLKGSKMSDTIFLIENSNKTNSNSKSNSFHIRPESLSKEESENNSKQISMNSHPFLKKKI